jgi:hypothetical protein
VLFYGGSVEYFRDIVFNYPTLAEAYKVAALDGLNNAEGHWHGHLIREKDSLVVHANAITCTERDQNGREHIKMWKSGSGTAETAVLLRIVKQCGDATHGKYRFVQLL